jgi:hypothetical protein
MHMLDIYLHILIFQIIGHILSNKTLGVRKHLAIFQAMVIAYRKLEKLFVLDKIGIRVRMFQALQSGLPLNTPSG